MPDRVSRAQKPAARWDADEAAVMYVFQANVAVHLCEEAVVSRAFAIPAGARSALQRLVAHGDLVREEGDPVYYRRPQDDLGGLLRRYLVRAGLGVVAGVLLAWLCQRLGLFHGSLVQPAITFSVLGSVPVVILVWRERRYRRREASPGRSVDDPE